MNKVTLEVAAIADALGRASTVAPDKGAAFDKASGIIIELHPTEEQIILRATNLDVFYTEWVDCLAIEGEVKQWRLPSKVLTAFVASLPIGSGKSVTFEENGKGTIKITSGRSTAQFRVIDPETFYPEWFPFDEDNMTVIPNLGARITQVEWAASKDVPALGIRFDGTDIMATDRYRLSVMPLKIEGMEDGITIPPSVLTAVLKKMGDAKIKVENNHLLIAPDTHTQLMIITIGEGFPNMGKVMRRDYPEKIDIRKTELIDIIQRTMKIASDRFPVLKLFIGREELATMMAEEERGFIGDVIAVPAQATHARIEVRYHPNNLLDALLNCPSEKIELHYDPAAPKKALLYIKDGSGYEVWLAPRQEIPPGVAS
jgi:DNA polymerase III sliding clamp (beta) subunit (PCNA family)